MESVILPRSRHTKLKPVSCKSVNLNGFFDGYITRNRKVSIPLLLRLFEKYGTIENFRICAGISKKEITRRLATDSDFYKWIEAVSWDLQNFYDERKVVELDQYIGLISKVQESDGYLNTFYTGDYRSLRLKGLDNSHELYCGGHLIQSAIAHFRSTGKENFLKIAIKWADYVCNIYQRRKIKENDGHPEVEMALVELYRTTGENRYLKLAGKLMDMKYVHLGNRKFLEMDEIVGHAVRMMYLLCGATDYYIETGDNEYRANIERLYDDLCSGKYYITGGIGSRYSGEAFGEKYELPNLRAYCETCASISLMMWLYRMFFVRQDAKYFDLFERVLYNSFLASVSLNGREYFYVNPLASTGLHQRRQWYKTTCCPPNFQRFISSLPAYFYARGENEIWFNLYDSNQASIHLENGQVFSARVKTDYPWSGKVQIEITLKKPEMVSVHFRIPGWSQEPEIRIKGKTYHAQAGSYFTIRVSEECLVEMDFNPRPDFFHCNPAIESSRNCIAIMRGPIVYCLEGCDNSYDIFNLFIPEQDLKLKTQSLSSLNEIVILEGSGFLNTDTGFVYASGFPRFKFRKVRFLAIPYFTWCNRKRSAMAVWLNAYQDTQ